MANFTSLVGQPLTTLYSNAWKLCREAAKDLTESHIEGALTLLQSMRTSRSVCNLYAILNPSVLRLESSSLILSGTMVEISGIARIAICLDSRWFQAFYEGHFSDSKRRIIENVDPVVIQTFIDRYYHKKAVIISFEGYIELIRFCKEFECEGYANELVLELIQTFLSTMNSEQVYICYALAREYKLQSLDDFLHYCILEQSNYDFPRCDTLFNAIPFCVENELNCLRKIETHLIKRIANFKQDETVKAYLLAKKHSMTSLHKMLDFYFARHNSVDSLDSLKQLQFLPVRRLHLTVEKDCGLEYFKELAKLFPNIEYIEIIIITPQDVNSRLVNDGDFRPHINLFKNLKEVIFRGTQILHKERHAKFTLLYLESILETTHIVISHLTMFKTNAATIKPILYLVDTAQEEDEINNFYYIPYKSTEEERMALNAELTANEKKVKVKPHYIKLEYDYFE